MSVFAVVIQSFKHVTHHSHYLFKPWGYTYRPAKCEQNSVAWFSEAYMQQPVFIMFHIHICYIVLQPNKVSIVNKHEYETFTKAQPIKTIY